MPTANVSDTTVAPNSASAADAELEAGLALALRAEDSGDWRPLVGWLAANPGRAAEVAAFVKDSTEIPRPPASRLGGYELKELIGEGGMGVVYRAFDTALKRDVAVKLLRMGVTFTAAQLACFRFEAEAVASLDHPNIVRVLAFGGADGVPFMVMPLMAGSLAGWLKERGVERQLPPRKAAEIVRTVALGVSHAHQRGVIHRDLKPGNILLDDAGTPHVADFGLARHVDATATTGIAGTAAYMAPEQARGEKGLTTAVDVHALGAILFELLTGQLPFGGGDLASVLRRVADEPPPLMKHFRTDVPADLESICRKCLEKRPEDRYVSAQELADDLERFRNGEPLPNSFGRGWLTDLARAFGGRRETPPMGSWWALFYGAASAMLAMVAIQSAVLLDAPPWVGASAMAYYLLAWLFITRWVQVKGRGSLTSVERFVTAQQYGMMLACTAVVPWQLPLAGEALAGVFRGFMAIVGVAIFSNGAIFWGRMYVAGLLHIGLAACFPLIPVRYWPGVYGLTSILFQTWAAVTLRRIHDDAVRAQPGIGR